MVNTNLNRKSLTEVYVILSMLPSKDLKKIPSNIIEGIEQNMDVGYMVDLKNIEKSILPETEKILATLYTYYLADQAEKNLINKLAELEKKQKYGRSINSFKEKQNYIKEEHSLQVVKEGFFSKIAKRIRKILRKVLINLSLKFTDCKIRNLRGLPYGEFNFL